MIKCSLQRPPPGSSMTTAKVIISVRDQYPSALLPIHHDHAHEAGGVVLSDDETVVDTVLVPVVVVVGVVALRSKVLAEGSWRSEGTFQLGKNDKKHKGQLVLVKTGTHFII